MKKTLKLLVVFIVLLGVLLPVHAQRVKLNASVDIQAAADNNPQVGEVGSFRPTLENFTPTFLVFPTLSADIKGSRTSGQLFYSLGISRFPQESDFNYESHRFGGQLQTQLSSKLHLDIHERFISSPDFNQSTVLEGIRVTPEGLFFDFENILVNSKSLANTAGLGLGYQLTPNSELSFGANYRLRRFSDEPEVSDLSDQDSYNGYIQFRKNIQERSSWDVRYSFSQNDFQNFQNSRNHNMGIGFSHKISPSVSLRLGAGSTLVESQSTGQQVGTYNGAVTIGYSREGDSISFGYRRLGGTTTGVGSISNSQHISLSFHKRLWRDLEMSGLVGAYETTPLFDNPVETRGVLASLVLLYPLKGGWSFQAGGSYNEQDGTSNYQGDRTRVFIGVRYSLPAFLTF